MCNTAIREAIVNRLVQHGPVRSTSGSIKELREACGIGGSNTQFSRALGSAIKNGDVVRHRPEPTCRDDDDRPITIFAARELSKNSTSSRSPYFVP